MSLLSASKQAQQISPGSSQPQQSPLPQRTPPPHPELLPAQAQSLPPGTPSTQEPEATARPPVTLVSQNSDSVAHIDVIDVTPGLSVSIEEAERLLDLYKTSYSPHCPFVPIPASTTAWVMLERQPLLLRTILQAVAPQSAATQRAADTWFREYIGQHLVVNQEKRLEILQAIIVYLSW